MASNGWGTAQKFYNYNRMAQAYNSYSASVGANSVTYTVYGCARSGNGTGNYYASGYTAKVELWYKVGNGGWVSLGSNTGTLNYGDYVGEITATVTLDRATSDQTVLFETDVSSPSGYWPYASSQSPDTIPALATYTVSYNANGGSGAPASQTKTRGAALTLSSIKPTWTGRTFQRWNTASNGSGTNYNPSASYTADANVTLYAQWRLNTYTVSYNANGGSGAPASQTKTFGTALTLSSTVPTRDDYTFLGWSTSQAAQTAQYPAGGKYTTDASTTLYAVWEFTGEEPEEDEDGIPTRNCFIVNAERGAVMGIGSGDAGKGAYLQLCDYGEWDGFKFSVKYLSDGTVRIVNKYGGRTIDVDDGAYEQGLVANVRLWDADETRIQHWRLVPTGGTVEFQDHTLSTYYIEKADDPTVVIDADATSGVVGSMLKLSQKDGLADQKWAFLGVPKLSSGGLYELRSMADTTKCAQIQSDSNAVGARLVLGDADGSRGDKFWLNKHDNDRWEILCAESGLALQIDSTTLPNESVRGVSQRESVQDVAVQQWAVTRVGSTEVDGVECTVVEVGNYDTSGSATSFIMDSSRADTTSDSRIVVTTRASVDTQRWALFPTELSDDALPVPANVGGTAEVGTHPSYTQLPMADVFYPCWDCTDGWTTPRPNHFEVRTSFAFQGPDGRWVTNDDGSVKSVGDSGWYTASVVRDDKRVWLADGVALPEGYAENWFAHCSVSVRCVSQTSSSDGTTRNVVGPYAFGAVTLYRVPNLSLTAAGLSPEGMRIGYESDYDIGRLSLTILSINDVDSGAEYLLDGDITFGSVDTDGSVLIPYTRVSALSGNKRVSVTYQLGSGLMRSIPEVFTWETTVTYNSGWDESWSSTYAKPELSYDRTTRSLTIKMQHVGTERVWLGNGVSSVRELSGVTRGAWTTFTATVTASGDQSIFATCYDPTQDRWGTYHEYIGEGSYFSRLYPPAHVWTWGSGGQRSFVLEANEDPVETRRTLEAIYEEHTVNKRLHSVVTFAATTRSEFEVSGIIYEGVTTGSVEDLVSLVYAKHATYTAPSGEQATVAIVGATYNRRKGFTSVTVEMIEESV